MGWFVQRKGNPVQGNIRIFIWCIRISCVAFVLVMTKKRTVLVLSTAMIKLKNNFLIYPRQAGNTTAVQSFTAHLDDAKGTVYIAWSREQYLSWMWLAVASLVGVHQLINNILIFTLRCPRIVWCESATSLVIVRFNTQDIVFESYIKWFCRFVSSDRFNCVCMYLAFGLKYIIFLSLTL